MRREILIAIIGASFLLSGCHAEIVPSKPPLVKVQQIKLSNAAQILQHVLWRVSFRSLEFRPTSLNIRRHLHKLSFPHEPLS